MATAELPRLGRALLETGELRERGELQLPDASLFDLPEKAVQFGTGAFLRGFVDVYVDDANRCGQFGGRIVAVSSTEAGGARDVSVAGQDGLFTLVTRGLENGRLMQEQRVIASLSRALSSRREWEAVLHCARNPQLELVVSNTTEVGIALDEGDAFEADPPRSFPGKLTRFLYERAKTFAFARSKGVVVLPCELIERNGDVLRDVVLELARRWQLGQRFIEWIEHSVPFCNTLVDRIVTGAPSDEERATLEATLGYRDALLTTAEPYRLFAIEADPEVGARLPFAGLPGVVITNDIRPYRERKVRLLNGAHTIMVSPALLCGVETVGEAAKHDLIASFVRRAMFDEIVPTVDVPGAAAFAEEVLDRFANPFIRHSLWDIALQSSMKMRVRIVPSVVRHAELTGRAPSSLAFAIAAHLLFARGDLARDRRSHGLAVPEDTQGERIASLWRDVALDESHNGSQEWTALARRACADESLWGVDLTRVPGFSEIVGEHLGRAAKQGVAAALEAHLASPAIA